MYNSGFAEDKKFSKLKVGSYFQFSGSNYYKPSQETAIKLDDLTPEEFQNFVNSPQQYKAKKSTYNFNEDATVTDITQSVIDRVK